MKQSWTPPSGAVYSVRGPWAIENCMQWIGFNPSDEYYSYCSISYIVLHNSITLQLAIASLPQSAAPA
ncbi:hypothetical protein COCSUDRAFT_33628 [Coccomyxa subellipsoidea C-169]|uniref:Uncharacterized protein n=1 Tax=Coccomyxa subellipsoidea (strain C-169) TaxID=574566 RepID=I0YUJ1_COCSC|nr:hypothetical protein COCSUDRAFT_33628 [Coccomyxa subellipsoidea C-169]EIE22060.1 hypothetical protein COCSUDRAFT_33628 [Coccomyxa subellipsoidea C-169]|eukprot:XP_005646604.1 hypothetical protein COCSUDRAFT_33628 [Coccomyxa subellipsoidea C-169]